MVRAKTRRHLSRDVAAGAVAMVIVWAADPAAQATRRFIARLSTVPITVAMQDSVSGRGTAEASLAGNALTIEGTFEGLRSPATFARLHLAPRATRGPAVHELTVSKDIRGTVRGRVELTDQQLQALGNSALYVQIHSEKAPDGNLWGWLLPQETKR